MAPQKRSKPSSKAAVKDHSSSLGPPKPFKLAPDSLKPFYETLSKKHVYLAHVDSREAAIKRKIFLVPVLMNTAVAVLFAWRMWFILPYYLRLLTSTLGYANETTLVAAELTWTELAYVVLGRMFTFVLDFCLGVFVWPWPIEFLIGPIFSPEDRGGGGSSPVAWRWAVGFRNREIYVRRSRSWDQAIGDVTAELDDGGRGLLWSNVRDATSPLLLQQKTGYLTMDANWDLDWAAMVHATALVDAKTLTLDEFRSLALLYNKTYGWLVLELTAGQSAKEEDRRRQVFAFRDALQAMGKEDLFYRWIEIIQFETSQPGGLSEEKQIEVAQKVRELFAASNVDFDGLWKESVGTDTIDGLS
ncbi:hypothetical protein B0H63DRAFT_179400 [Podospora didyma]|uniref:Uncharacterized protein n=1 Tax=Podospora didyma TaxID=330526 RepID=A0AAE0NPH6_9PEZI|nr:hypothetical protein B0H63DRAFT_179400 [Podospora didyma]